MRNAAVKCGGASPEWTHIPTAAPDNLIKACGDWYTAYSVCLKPHTRAETAAKNEVKKAAAAMYRQNEKGEKGPWSDILSSIVP